MKIAEIFEDEPTQLGLRGDPYLWRELKEKFKTVEMPQKPEKLQALIEKEYKNSTGQIVSNLNTINIPRFRSHGMSGGSVSPKFWLNRAIQILVTRSLVF